MTMQESEAQTGNLQADYALLKDAVREAGALALGYYKRADLDVRDKGGNDPVTEADLAVNAFLKSHLHDARPDYGWLSEETEDHPARLDADRCWIIDPIDGTRAFVNHKPQWCIAAALVEQGQPIAAAVFNPVTDEFYHAAKGHGAYLNERRLSGTDRPSLDGAQVLTTAVDLKKKLWNSHFGDVDRFHVNSVAYKIALVAEGRYDAFFSLRGSNDWDIAGATLVAEEAGITVTDLTGQRFVFNQANTRHGSMIVAPAALAEEVRLRMQNLAADQAK